MRERLGWEAEDVERAGDREVRLVARVHARALERARARRVVESEQPREVDVPRDRERHDVRHHAAGREHRPRALAEPDQRPQPAP